jgi:hypothetical protein
MSHDAATYDPAAQGAQEAEAGQAGPPTPHQPVPGPRFSRARLVLGAAALLAVLVAGAVAALLLTGGSPDVQGNAGQRPVATPSAAGTATVGAPVISPTPGQPAPAGPARNPFVAPTGADAAGGTGSTPVVTVTRTVTVTPSASPAPLYVGLYGWTGAKASFRVNQTPYLEASGQTFGGLFTFVGPTTLGSQQCAKVLFGTVTTTVCPGEVKQVR